MAIEDIPPHEVWKNHDGKFLTRQPMGCAIAA